MDVLKNISLILLAVYLILNPLSNLLGFGGMGISHFVVGLSAALSGILMLVSVKECLHCSDSHDTH